MIESSSPPKEFRSHNADFRLRYAWPKAYANTNTPCRGCLDPLDPLTGKPLSKHFLYGTDSNQPVHYMIYGKDPWDIWYNHLEAAVAHLAMLMAQQGLIANSSTHIDDPANTAKLDVLARNFKDTFFMLHRNEWKARTVDEYQRQYDVLLKELGDFSVSNLDNTAYRNLQETICHNAVANARKLDAWMYGDEPPSSARKRMSLLYELIQDLKQVEGIPIPAVPTRYNSKPSRQQQLLDRIDSARSLPESLLRSACAQPPLQGQAGLMIDAGLRISEDAGLLFDSLRAIDTSQGTLYYVEITGQLSPSGKRTEITKTDSSYRTVPISYELAQDLVRYRQKLEETHGDLSLRLLCGQGEEDGFNDSPAKAAAWQERISKLVPQLLRQKDFSRALASARAYCFSQKAQDIALRDRSTCHALRRNFCTWLYCQSGLDTAEIYRQMGHSYGPLQKKAAGLTPEELRRMCLRKYVSPTLYHSANPLRYSVDGAQRMTEVPACEVILTLPTGTSIELTVEDSEPGNVIQITGEGLNVQLLLKDERHDMQYTYALLADEAEITILTKHKLFQ